MKFLVESGAEINLADIIGKTALHWAALGGHEGVAWWLQMITIMGDTVLSYSDGLFSNRLVTQSCGFVFVRVIDCTIWKSGETPSDEWNQR